MAILLMVLGAVAWFWAWKLYMMAGSLTLAVHSTDFLLLVLIASVLTGFAGAISAINRVRQAIEPTKSMFSRLYIQDEPKKPENGG